MAKRGLCMLLALVTLFTLAVPAFAAEEPVVTEEPVVEAAEEPAVEATEEPVVEASEEPAVETTEEPAVEATEEPAVEATEEPIVEVTEEPAVTEEPVVTEEPIVTEEPVVTEVPEATEAPETAGEPVSAAATSGECGANVKWAFDAGTGTLTITGTGAMTDYTSSYYQPWKFYNGDQMDAYGPDKIRSVIVGEGVTSLGNYAFSCCRAIASVQLPSTLTRIGHDAFSGCISLAGIDIPNGVTSIERTTFSFCTSLTRIGIPASVTSVGLDAFRDTPWLAAQGDFVIINDWLYLYQGKDARVTVPDTVKVLSGIYEFPTETLEELIVPKSVTRIGGFCFNECPNLRSVTVYNSKAEFSQLYDPTCPTSPDTLELASYSTSEAHTWVVCFGNRDHLTFRDLGPEPTTAPVPTATPKPASAKLATPKITKMENTASGLKVTWGKVSGAVRYTVFYKLKGAKDWTKIGTTTATSYTRKAKDLKNGETYVFTIRCVANDKKTYTSDYDKAGKSLTYYAPPTVKIAKASNGGIKATWNKVSGVSRYMVYYKENGGSWKKIGTTAAASYTRAAKYLKNGRTYQFTVRCVANDKKTMLSSYKASNSLKYKK